MSLRQLFFFIMALRPDLLERPGAAAADIERMKSAIRQKLQHRLEVMHKELKKEATGGGYFDSKTTRALWQTLESPLLCECTAALVSLLFTVSQDGKSLFFQRCKRCRPTAPRPSAPLFPQMRRTWTI